MPKFNTESNEEVFISSMYGARHKKGMVQIQIGEWRTQLSVLEAQKIAHCILEAAQGAITDEAVFEFFMAQPGPKDQAMQLAAACVYEIRKKQNRNDQRIFEN